MFEFGPFYIGQGWIFTFTLHDDVFDEGLRLPRRLGAVHVDGVLHITDNLPSPVGISR